MKIYKIRRLRDSKTYFVKAKDEADAVSRLEDDRLSPMTYKKLRELGYDSEKWKNLTQEQANEIIASSSQNNQNKGTQELNNKSRQINYANLVRNTSDINYNSGNSSNYIIAKDYIVNEGRGLNERLSKPEDQLSEEEKSVKSAIENSMIPAPVDFKTYRTDDINWLSKFSEGNIIDLGVYISSSIYSNLVIPENQNKVKQRIVFNIPKDSDILATNNAGEGEIAIGGKNQTAVIDKIEKDTDGIPIYYISIKRGRK